MWTSTMLPKLRALSCIDTRTPLHDRSQPTPVPEPRSLAI